MAKPLTIQFAGESVDFDLEKVDRAKLYGYVDTEVLDEAGKRCELGTLAGDGHSVVGKGGTALAYLSHDGLWKTKADLKPVDVDGKPIEPVRSTFDAPVALDTKVSVDEYLSHNIASIYQLSTAGTDEALRKELAGGAIFSFPFSYRGGLEASVGFLLTAADGQIFLCVGTPTKLEFVGLTETAAVLAEDTAGDDDDALDFSLV